MSEVIAVANQKGGVGKTTTVVSLAAYLALDGYRTLLVDLDAQGNATSGVGIDKRSAGPSIYEVLAGSVSLSEAVQPTQVERLDICASSGSLAGAEVELVAVAGREWRLRDALANAGDTYDYVLIDCPPSLGLLTVNALAAADSVLVPIQCEYYALEGLGALVGTIDRIRDRLNPRLRLRGVLLTMYDGRTSLSADVSRDVHQHLGDRVFRTVVPRSVRLAEAPSYGRPISAYSPSSRGAQAYHDLAAELTGRTAATSSIAEPDGGTARAPRSTRPDRENSDASGQARRPAAAAPAWVTTS